MGLFDFSDKELHEIWDIEDKYFQFNYNEYKTFGSRLKKWRELAGYTQREIAEYLYDSYEELGKTPSKIDSIQRKYLSWESNDQEIKNILLSMTDLYLLKKLIGCDYEFLFCEINTLHKNTNELVDYTGLNNTSIETLLSLSDIKLFNFDDEHSALSLMKQLVISAIAMDEKLLLYLSYFLTTLESDKEDQIVHIDIPCITKNELDSKTSTLKYNDLMDVHLFTIVNLLSKIKDSFTDMEPSFDLSNLIKHDSLCSTDSPLGSRIKSWRDLKGITQKKAAEMLCEAAKELHSEQPSFESVMRTLQNWESKKSADDEVRIHIGDLMLLKHIMGCDYAYLFGNINCLYIPFSTPQKYTGLTKEALNSIYKYAHPADTDPAYYRYYLQVLDMIISDEELLFELAMYLIGTPVPVDYADSDILKPSELQMALIRTKINEDYSANLYTEDEESNILLPLICKRLIMHRNDTQKIKDIIEKHNTDAGIF